jgi:hypothetical protein
MYLTAKRLQNSCKRLQRLQGLSVLTGPLLQTTLPLVVFGLGEPPRDSHRPVVPPEDGFEELLHL